MKETWMKDLSHNQFSLWLDIFKRQCTRFGMNIFDA
jgi:hypothetical protein